MPVSKDDILAQFNQAQTQGSKQPSASDILQEFNSQKKNPVGNGSNNGSQNVGGNSQSTSPSQLPSQSVKGLNNDDLRNLTVPSSTNKWGTPLPPSPPTAEEQWQSKHNQMQNEQATQNAVIGTAKERLKNDGTPPTQDNLIKSIQQTTNDLNSGKLAATKDDNGNTSLATSAGFWESAANNVGNTLSNLKYSLPIAYAKIKGDDKMLSDIAEDMSANKQFGQNHPYAALAGLLNTTNPLASIQGQIATANDKGEQQLDYHNLAANLGGISASLGTNLAPLLVPGGEAAEAGNEAALTLSQKLAQNAPRMLTAAGQSYLTDVPEKFQQLYEQNKQDLLNQGHNEQDAKQMAAHKASSDAAVEGILPSVAQGAFFSGGFDAEPKSANNFVDVALDHMKSAAKFSGIMGAQAGAEDLIKNWQGYKTNTTSDIVNAAGMGFAQTLGLHLLPEALSLPSKVKNSLYNYAVNNISEPALTDYLKNFSNGDEIGKNIDAFKEALDKIPQDLPEDKKADIAPLVKQKTALTEEMNGKDNTFKESYQQKIAAIDDQIKQIVIRPTSEEIANENAQKLLPKLQGVETPEPSYLISRHGDTVKDEQSKVSGIDMNPLSTDGKKDANDLANEVQQHAIATNTPVEKVVSSDLERAKETAQTVADKTGAIVAHDPDLRTWDIGEFNDTKDEDFKKVQKYFVEHPDETIYKPDIETKEGEKPEDKDPLYGKKVGETFNDYKDRTIEAHKKYEGEPSSTMLIDHSNNMMVMDAYRKNGNTWDDKAAQDYLKSEKPEPATLQNKIKNNEPNTGTATNESASQSKTNNENKSSQQPTEKTVEPNEGTNTSAQPTEEGKTISTKNSVTDLLRNENGLPPVEIPADRSKDASLSAWKDGTRHPLQIVDQLLGDKDIYNKSITPNDEPIMREYIRGLTNRGIELNRLNEELAEKVKNGDKDAELDQSTVKQQLLNHYDEMQRALDAERIGGNIWHKYGEERQIVVNEKNQLLNGVNRIKAIYGDNMPEALKNQLSDLQKQYDALVAKNLKIESDYQKKIAENELLKRNKKTGTTTKTKKTSTDFSKERDKILADMQTSLKKARGNTYATFPGVPQLIAIAPHVLDLVKSFGEQGITKLDEMVDKIHDIVKDAVEGISKEDVRDIIAGKYNNEKESLKRKFESQPEFKKNEVARIALRQKLKNMEEAAYNSQKSWYMRKLDLLNRWGRRVIFFGANAIYTKLSSAAVLGSFLHRPFEQFAGKINTKLYPHLAKGAPVEGYINLAAEGKFYREFLNPAKFVKNTWEIAKTGESKLSAELGSHSNQHHVPLLDLFAADAHIMIKDPVKRATFEASQLNHMKYFANNSIDPTHPLMLEAARQAAFKTAEYEIFQNSTKKAAGINHFFDELERKGIVNNGMPSTWDKVKGNAQYTAASLYHFFVPINTVPFNIISRVGLGLKTPLTMTEAFAKNKAIKEGIMNLSADESDLLMRQLKKGQIGTAYWTLGFILGGSALGGLWTRYDPDKKRGNQAKIDQMKLGSVSVPKDVQHNSQLQSMQMGATWRTVHDHFIHGESKGSQLDAIYKATMATGGAALESAPSLEEGGKLYDALTTPYGGDKFVKDLKQRVGIGKAFNLLNAMGYGDDKKK